MATGLFGAIGELAQSHVEVGNNIEKDFATTLHLPMEELHVLGVALMFLHATHKHAFQVYFHKFIGFEYFLEKTIKTCGDVFLANVCHSQDLILKFLGTLSL